VALVHHHGVALRYAAPRGGLVRGIEWNHHRDYSGRRAVAAAVAAWRRAVMEGQGDAIAREYTVKGGSDRRDDTHVVVIALIMINCIDYDLYRDTVN
jgi:hypothetical protein